MHYIFTLCFSCNTAAKLNVRKFTGLCSLIEKSVDFHGGSFYVSYHSRGFCYKYILYVNNVINLRKLIFIPTITISSAIGYT
jgi:hypothetical protein